jgi:hypothetical protein
MGSTWDEEFVGKADVLEIIGGVDDVTAGDELINRARESSELFVLKTHFPPATDDPAIYLLRDGRAATVSFFHYINEISKIEKTLEQVITGDIMFGDWSSHLQSWSPDTRRNTLMIKFENLTTNPELEIDRIGKFLGIKPLRSHSTSSGGLFFQPYPIESNPFSFANLQSKYPDFFRAGDNNKNIKELEASGQDVAFWGKHKFMMERFGYGST